ncbi:MAG: zf-HC2 domain-containing protein [Gemmatimonadetes bacterium]|nr:zf-HC2 domain-containing protein [Gemmatimonadota bacterium]
MAGHPTERLSEYLDGELAAAERADIEAHLAACAACAAVLADLQRVVGEARTLQDRPLEGDLWPAIAARLEPRARGAVVFPLERARRRFSFTLPQLAAAALAVIALSVGAMWWARPSDPVDAGTPERPVSAVLVSNVGDAGDVSYAAAVAEMERVFAASKDRLDPETVRAVEANLAIIERAIEETREALASDPNSVYLHGHLADTQRRKIEVLRDATQQTLRSI